MTLGDKHAEMTQAPQASQDAYSEPRAELKNKTWGGGSSEEVKQASCSVLVDVGRGVAGTVAVTPEPGTQIQLKGWFSYSEHRFFSSVLGAP